MSVIEALMILYAKEVASGDRVSASLARISGGSLPANSQNYEAALLCWISHVCAALKKRINLEIENGATDENVIFNNNFFFFNLIFDLNLFFRVYDFNHQMYLHFVIIVIYVTVFV